MTTVAEMTDLELEIALERCFAQHKDAESTRKAVLHSCAMDVLAEQKRRRWAALGLSCSA